MADGWLNVEDIAKAVGVDRITVYRWINSGWLPASKQGRRWVIAETWLEWIKLWRDHQTHATKAIGFRLTPELYQILADWAERGGMTVQKAAIWLWMRGVEAEGKTPSAYPFMLENPEIETVVRDHAEAWNVDLPTAAAWLIVRGSAVDQSSRNE